MNEYIRQTLEARLRELETNAQREGDYLESIRIRLSAQKAALRRIKAEMRALREALGTDRAGDC